IDEIYTQLHGVAQNRDRFWVILGGTPDAFTREAHRAEPESMDGNYPAQRNTPSQTCRYLFHLCPFLHDAYLNRLQIRRSVTPIRLPLVRMKVIREVGLDVPTGISASSEQEMSTIGRSRAAIAARKILVTPAVLPGSQVDLMNQSAI